MFEIIATYSINEKIRCIIIFMSCALFITALLHSLKAFWFTKKMSKDRKETIKGGVNTDDIMNLSEYIMIQKRDVRDHIRSNDKGQYYYPDPFILDAIQQVSENFFEKNFIAPISMYANLLPPLGFVGTIAGMIVVFNTAAEPGSARNLAGLSTALLTTFFALIGFVILEFMGIFLLKRANLRIKDELADLDD